MRNPWRAAPIFSVADVDAALSHYQRLGFVTRRYEGGGYGYAARNGVEIHLAVPVTGQPVVRGSAYLWVDDAEALAAEWRSAGVSVHPPEDTAWGQHEGAHVDPDGNTIRFGSPLQQGHSHRH